MFSPSRSHRFSALTGLRAALPSIRRGTLGKLIGLRRQRATLRTLDDRLLRDIGVTRAEAETEAARSSWDVPGNWRL